MWLAVFICLLLFLIALPLLPGILELKKPSDASPLKVTQDYDINVKHFAFGFRNYIKSNSLVMSLFEENNLTSEGILEDKSQFIVLDDKANFMLTKSELKKNIVNRLVIAKGNVILSDNMRFEAEIYANADLTGGIANNIRAALAEGYMIIKEKTTVFRWIHSGNNMEIGKNCNLFGRASCDTEMLITGNCRFERLHAKEIIFARRGNIETFDIESRNLNVIDSLPNIKEHFERRLLIKGDVNIPDNSIFDGDLVATGVITLGKNSVIRGSIKSNAELTLQEGSAVIGSVVSAGDLSTLDACRIMGVVIAEGDISIGTNNIIGSLESPVTVSSMNNAIIYSGTVIFGTIRVGEQGFAIISRSEIVDV